MSHTFTNRCIDFDSLLQHSSLSKILKVASHQSHSQEARNAYNQPDDFCSEYYGAFTEWFAEQFLNYYGSYYNITNVNMLDSVGSSDVDMGVDGTGINVKAKRHSCIKSIIHETNAHVHIQVKGSQDPTKEFRTNDGSRLPNFIMHSTTTAMVNCNAYQDRYVLFTTAKGIHHSLVTASNNIIEVIGYHTIKRRMVDDTCFLDYMRTEVELAPFGTKSPSKDRGGEYNLSRTDI